MMPSSKKTMQDLHSSSAQTREKVTNTLTWLTWFGAALFYCYQFIVRVSPGIMAQDLMADFRVTGCDLGLLGAYYYRAYALMQIPLGILLDRFGACKLLTISCLVTACGVFLFAKSTAFEMAAFGRLLMGMGSACGLIGTLKISSQLFPPQMIGRIIGMTMVLGTIGATMAGMPLGYLMDQFSWRGAMMIIALAGLILAIFIFTSSKGTIKETPEEKQLSVNILESLFKIISSRQIWLVSLFGSLMYVPLAAIADLWGTPYMEAVYQIDRKVAATIVSMIYVGVAVGSPFTAYFSDYFKKRKLPMLIGALGSTGVYLLMLLGPQMPQWMMYGLMFLGGFFFTGQCLVFAVGVEIMPLTMTGMVIGFINMIIMLSGVIFEPLVGWLLDLASQNSTYVKNYAFTAHDFSLALLPVPLSLIIAILILRGIQESYPLLKE